MTDRRLGIGIGLVLGVAAVILFVFVLSDDTVDAPAVDETIPAQTTTKPASTKPDKPAKPSLPTIEVVGGQPKGGVEELEADKGETVEFRVRSDIAEHVHVHGYDLFKDIAAGGMVKFSFVAEIDGIFEIELEDSAVQIAELRVNP
jgi:hypothetical protein